uniref:Chromo domain-containing protein n=1 Tax=Heterorhabditis bacteriophora TaxID=37862 RepID=A0A1I7WHY2_HETBA
MSPIKGSDPVNKPIVYQNLFSKDKKDTKLTKFKVGDNVRITKYKSIFDRGYLPNWTTEKFIINTVYKTNPTTYEIKDLADEVIKDKFYDEDLTIFENTNHIYKVEKLLKRRTRDRIKEILVKWYEYPDKFNSWIPETKVANNPYRGVIHHPYLIYQLSINTFIFLLQFCRICSLFSNNSVLILSVCIFCGFLYLKIVSIARDASSPLLFFIGIAQAYLLKQSIIVNKYLKLPFSLA